MRASGFVGLFCVALFLVATPTHANTFEFVIEFDGSDATVSGFFAGIDTSDDGSLTGNEITSWEGIFDPGTLGSQGFEISSANGDELVNFEFDIDLNSLEIVSAGYLPGGPFFEYIMVAIAIIDPNGFPFVDSAEAAVTKVVPLPPALWLLGSALLVAGRRSHRKRSA